MPQLRGECLAAEDYIEENYIPVIVVLKERCANRGTFNVGGNGLPREVTL